MKRVWIQWKFTRKESLLSFLEKYGFTEVKFPFGTSSFGRYGAGIILWRTDNKNIYFLVVPYDRNTSKKVLKRDLLLEMPEDTALRKFKEETNLTPNIKNEVSFSFEVQSDESRKTGNYGVHTKHFFLSDSWRGRVFDFSKRKIKHRNKSGRIGTPLWVEANVLLSLMGGTHKEALIESINHLTKDIRLKVLYSL